MFNYLLDIDKKLLEKLSELGKQDHYFKNETCITDLVSLAITLEPSQPELANDLHQVLELVNTLTKFLADYAKEKGDSYITALEMLKDN